MSAPPLSDYALWLIPSPDESVPLSHLVAHLASLEPSSPIFTPHITLWHPVPKSSGLTEVQCRLERIVKEAKEAHHFTSLKLELQPAQQGDKYYQSVLAPVKPTPSLLALREACAREWGKEEKPYFPHLSLFYGDLSPARRDEIAEVANGSKARTEDSATGRLLSSVTVGEVVVVDMAAQPDKWKIVGSVKV